jgi:hypothetical protein
MPDRVPRKMPHPAWGQGSHRQRPTRAAMAQVRMPGRRQLYAVENLLGLADQAIRLRRHELFTALRLHLVAVGIDLIAAFLGVPFRKGARIPAQ